jgi:hypothetical protein
MPRRNYDAVCVVVHVEGSDYVSELRPPKGPLFVPQVIYEYGEPRWNYIDRGKLLILP